MKKRVKMGNRLNVFISYRRADSEDFSGRLHDSLVRDYDNVFFDTEDGIGAGERFLTVIINEIEKADVFLMVVGEESATHFKKKKAEGKEDYVLKEIVHAQKSSCMIIPVLLNGVKSIGYSPQELEFVKELSYYEFAHAKFSLNFLGLKQELEKVTSKESSVKESTFLQEVLDGIERERLVVLLSQDFTNIDKHYQSIKLKVQSKFKNEFYLLSVPSFEDDPQKYFSCIATDCGVSCEVTKVSEWSAAMKKKLKSSNEPLLLFVTNLEDGNEKLDKQFATILRNLKNEFPHFHALCVGRKALAHLVYAEGVLSPLNTAKELFFPDVNMKLGEEKIAQQFQTMGKHGSQLCKFLKKETLGRYSTWSYNETINQLFWKNLLVKNGKDFVWRGELTKKVGREVLGCDEDVV